MKFFLLLLLSVSAYAQTTIAACGGVTLSNAAIADINAWRFTQLSGNTLLAAPMSDTDTTATLVNGSVLNADGGQFVVDSEAVTYTSASGNVASGLTRGASGTKAAEHAGPVAASEKNPAVNGATVSALTYESIPSLCQLRLVTMFQDIIQAQGAASTVIGPSEASRASAQAAKQSALAAAVIVTPEQAAIAAAAK